MVFIYISNIGIICPYQTGESIVLSVYFGYVRIIWGVYKVECNVTCVYTCLVSIVYDV